MTFTPLKYIYMYVIQPEKMTPVIKSMVEAWYFGKPYNYKLGTPFDMAKFLAKAPQELDKIHAKGVPEYTNYLLTDTNAYIEYLRLAKKYYKPILNMRTPNITEMTPMQVAKAVIILPDKYLKYLAVILEDFEAYLYVMKRINNYDKREILSQFNRLIIPKDITRKFNDLPEYVRTSYLDRKNGIYRSNRVESKFYKPYQVLSDNEARRLVDYPKYAYKYLLDSYRDIKPSTRKMLLKVIRKNPSWLMNITQKYISEKKRVITKIINRDVNSIKEYLYVQSCLVMPYRDKKHTCETYIDIIMKNPHVAFETFDHVYGLNYCIHEELKSDILSTYHKSMLQDIKTTIRYLGSIDYLWEHGLNLVMHDPKYCIMYLMAMQHNKYYDDEKPIKLPDAILKYVMNNAEVLSAILNMEPYGFKKNIYCDYDILFESARNLDVPFAIRIK